MGFHLIGSLFSADPLSLSLMSKMVSSRARIVVGSVNANRNASSKGRRWRMTPLSISTSMTFSASCPSEVALVAQMMNTQAESKMS